MDGQAAITYDLDLVSGELKWGDALYTIMGFDRAEPAGSTEWWSDHIHPEDAMTLNQNLDKLLNPVAAGWTVTYRFRRADNSFVLVEDRAAIIRDAGGEAVHLTGTLTIANQSKMPLSS